MLGNGLLLLALATLPGALLAQQQSSAPQPGRLAQNPPSKQQPSRVLGFMPNFRTVSPGEHPPPPAPGEAFKMATVTSFDYSAFLFNGFTSLISEWSDSHPKIGTNPSDYWGYYWRGFIDKADASYLTMFALPTVFHQDERYYILGSGSIWKRTLYAATRVFITPNYHGRNSLNASELLGRAMAAGISSAYYPGEERTGRDIAARYGYAVMRDSLTNIFLEFWPDIAAKVLHWHR